MTAVTKAFTSAWSLDSESTEVTVTTGTFINPVPSGNMYISLSEFVKSSAPAINSKGPSVQ